MMKRSLFIIFIITIFLPMLGCEAKGIVKEPVVEKVKTIPLHERKYVYHNGIELDYREVETADDNEIKLSKHYPVITGLKNQAIQDKINNEFHKVTEEMLLELESNVIEKSKNILRYNKRYTNARIIYSFNNVIFVEYNATFDSDIWQSQLNRLEKSRCYGYDLNTGNRIGLDDIFQFDSDCRTKINNYISQYIIENNLDDYEYDVMSKPFQGIRKNQSFSMSLEGLTIILDEKNDEFFNNSYILPILIPLDYLGDDLVIFDKFFIKSDNIYNKEKLIKKLFPNQFAFRINEVKEEGNEKYFLSITYGEFIDIPNQDIVKKLNNMVIPNVDTAEFKKKANDLNGQNDSAHLVHYIGVYTNAGGYLSMAVSDETYMNRVYYLNRKTYNYDFNEDKELSIRDIFMPGTDIARVLRDRIQRLYYTTNEKIDSEIENALQLNQFYFDENGVHIFFSLEGTALMDHQKWIYISFEEFGLENVQLFQ